MAERIEQIKAELLASRQRLDSVLDAAAGQNGWETTVYADGWNAKQLLVHVMDADRGHNGQVKGIAEGREVIPADFDLERYNKRSVEKRAEMPIDEARQALNNQRTELLTWLDGIDDATLDMTGRHASLNIMSIEQILRHLANHERTHADDMARALGID